MRNLRNLVFLLILACGIYSCSKKVRPKTPPLPKTFAYVTGYYTLDVCDVNVETGRFTGCQDSGFAQYVFSNSITVEGTSVATLTVGQQTFAYIANHENGVVYQCLINANTGLFTSCTPSGSTLFGSPVSITFNTAQNGNTYAYVLDSITSSPKLYQCLVNPVTGNFSSCSSTTLSITYDGGLMSFTTVGGQNYIYIPSYDGNRVSHCQINAVGNVVTPCTTQTITGFIDPFAIAFVTIANQTYAYVTQYEDTAVVFQCTVNSANGALTNCFPAFFLNTYTYYTGIAVQSINNQLFVYIANSAYYEYSTPNVVQCGINPVTANLQNCSDSGVGSILPYIETTTNIAFAQF